VRGQLHSRPKVDRSVPQICPVHPQHQRRVLGQRSLQLPLEGLIGVTDLHYPAPGQLDSWIVGAAMCGVHYDLSRETLPLAFVR